MILYPAIDLYKGKVVRLSRGDFQAETVYSKDPPAQAKVWESQGAQWVHVVDLEGAKTGELRNLSWVLKIRQTVGCSLQVGGGLRRAEDVELLLREGINRVVIGTKALDQKFFLGLLERFGSQIAVSLDTREGRVQTEGWLKESGESLESMLKRFNELALSTVIYTDIARDGMLQGPNLEGLAQVLEWSRSRVILSGGISVLADIEQCRQLKQTNFDGVIMGKALYEKRFELRDAIRAAAGQEKTA